MGVTHPEILAQKIYSAYHTNLENMHQGVRELLDRYQQLIPSLEKWIESRIEASATQAIRNAVLRHLNVVTFEVDIAALAKEAWEKSPPKLKAQIKVGQLSQMMVLIAIDSGWIIEDNKIHVEIPTVIYEEAEEQIAIAAEPEVPAEPEPEPPLMLAEPPSADTPPAQPEPNFAPQAPGTAIVLVDKGIYANAKGMVRRIDKIVGDVIHWTCTVSEDPSMVGQSGQTKAVTFKKWATQKVEEPG